MNELTNPLQSLINKASENKAAPVVDKFKKRLSSASDIVLILADVSSSMGEAAGGKLKIDVLRDALDRTLPLVPLARLIAFSSTPAEVSLVDLPQPNGGTDLAKALTLALGYKPRQTIVISDGRPDHPAAALRVAEDLTGTIDVIYCGPDSDSEAIAFMRKLAALSGGSIIVRDIAREHSALDAPLRQTLRLPMP